MSDSILQSVKEALNVPAEYTAYDGSITMHINAALADLSEAGVGPETGFAIQDGAATWSDFLGDNNVLNRATTYVCLLVKLVFDPSPNPSVTAAMERQINESLWRARAAAEASPLPRGQSTIILDAGSGF